MDARWLKGKEVDKDQRRKEVMAYRNAFDDLKEILEQHFKKKPAVRDYSDEGWAYQQIAVNEYNAVLEDVLKLIKLDKE